MSVPSTGQLNAALAPDGVVAGVVERFATKIGLWPSPITPHAG